MADRMGFGVKAAEEGAEGEKKRCCWREGEWVIRFLTVWLRRSAVVRTSRAGRFRRICSSSSAVESTEAVAEDMAG